jgi:hypothetical protein
MWRMTWRALYVRPYEAGPGDSDDEGSLEYSDDSGDEAVKTGKTQDEVRHWSAAFMGPHRPPRTSSIIVIRGASNPCFVEPLVTL